MHVWQNCLTKNILEKDYTMKKLLVVALLASALSLTACMGVRGYHGSQKVCENQSLLGISLIEVLSPCNR